MIETHPITAEDAARALANSSLKQNDAVLARDLGLPGDESVGSIQSRRTGQGYQPVRVPIELMERLRIAADERGVSVQWITARLLSEGLERLIPAEELKFTRGGGERSGR